MWCNGTVDAVMLKRRHICRRRDPPLWAAGRWSLAETAVRSPASCAWLAWARSCRSTHPTPAASPGRSNSGKEKWLVSVTGRKPSRYKGRILEYTRYGTEVSNGLLTCTQTHFKQFILTPSPYLLPASDNVLPCGNFAITGGKTEISAPHMGRHTQNSCKCAARVAGRCCDVLLWKTDTAVLRWGVAATQTRVQCVQHWRSLIELLQTPAHFQQTD